MELGSLAPTPLNQQAYVGIKYKALALNDEPLNCLRQNFKKLHLDLRQTIKVGVFKVFRLAFCPTLPLVETYKYAIFETKFKTIISAYIWIIL